MPFLGVSRKSEFDRDVEAAHDLFGARFWPPVQDQIHHRRRRGAGRYPLALEKHPADCRGPISHRKIAPQDAYVDKWPPAIATWARGAKCTKLIGYDASPADTKRYAHAEGIANPKYDFAYPLREWGWDRARCAARIRDAGLPVPIKSACFMCGAAKPAEIETLPRWCLRLIVLLEARAAPRLRNVEGLWRKGTKARPGSMTAFIRQRALLAAAEIDAIVASAPPDLVRFQDIAAVVPVEERPDIKSWIERFNAGVFADAA